MSRFSYFQTYSGDWSTNKSCTQKAPQHRKEWGWSSRKPLQRQRQLCAGDQEGQVVLHLQAEVRRHQVLCWLRYLQQLVPRQLRQYNAKDVEKDVRVSHDLLFLSVRSLTTLYAGTFVTSAGAPKRTTRSTACAGNPTMNRSSTSAASAALIGSTADVLASSRQKPRTLTSEFCWKTCMLCHILFFSQVRLPQMRSPL